MLLGKRSLFFALLITERHLSIMCEVLGREIDASVKRRDPDTIAVKDANGSRAGVGVTRVERRKHIKTHAKTGLSSRSLPIR